MVALKRLSVRGEVRPPGDKSISHRALILAGITRGKSRITGLLDSADVRSTAGALRALGAVVPPVGEEIVVTGQPARFLRAPRDPLDCGNSGTTARLLAGVAAGAGIAATFEGDASLSRRPMTRVAEPLRAMGANVTLPAHGGLPMTVMGAPLHFVEWESAVASAQVKSAILLAALLGGTGAVVREPHRSRDHTERMLRARGVEITVEDRAVEIAGGQILLPLDAAVPADPSSAAFLVAVALLADDGELVLRDVCLNETRTGFFRILRRMGADIELADRRDEGGEPVGSIVARPSALTATDIRPDEVPSLIDELPLFACLAASAEGESIVTGARELRVKESDRIRSVVGNLRSLGARAEELEDGFRVEGSGAPLKGRVATAGDHRLAMSFGVLAAHPRNRITIDDPACVEVSFPGFWNDLARITA